jgi:glycosyltransferase involved in cell wall biosynthesis
LRILPSSLKQDLRGRYHPDLANAHVEGLNFSALKFELLSRIRHQPGWTQTIARNRWFQRRVVGYLCNYEPRTDNQEPTLFSYSHAAREIFRFAKSRGWRTVLGQIDPGPVEEKIVAEEVAHEPALAGEWVPAPASYWSDWHEECTLADRIVVNSKWSRSCLVEAGVNDSKLFVIPLAYESPITDTLITREYPPHFTRDRPLRVLFLGQINLRKGVRRLIRAIRLLEHEEIEFQFVGPVQISIPDDIRNNPRVRWRGPVPRSEVGGFYQNADVLIFPTLSDGFGLTQLEAQAYSLPVIASPYCGEVVTNGKNGLVFNELSGEAIADALRSCLREPSQLRSFATNAVVGEQFKLKSVTEKLRGLFEREDRS